MPQESIAAEADGADDEQLTAVFFRPVQWQSAFEETVERLSQAIKLGAVPLGSQLPSERELVAKLQVSRTTLREAIRALQQEGILRTRRGRSGGTFVASDGARLLTKAEARRLIEEMGPALAALMDVRSAVEPKAAELAAERAEPEALERLRALLERFQGAPVGDLRRGDSLLHIAIAHLASSDMLMDSVLKVQTRLHDLLAFLAVVPTPQVAARHESRQHEKIVDAILARDAAGAHLAMANHVAATEELLAGILKGSASSSSRTPVARAAGTS